MIEPADYPKLALDAFNRRDLDALGALWSPDFHYLAPGDESHGREAALERERRLYEAFPDIVATATRQVADAERLALEVTLTGTHRGALRVGGLDLPATGRALRFEFAAVFELRDGLVRSERIYYDRAELMAQLEGAAR
jgi:steroid delta-isomerase-like uncharacterized protein